LSGNKEFKTQLKPEEEINSRSNKALSTLSGCVRPILAEIRRKSQSP
jgi:hypothetical protein